MMASAFDGFGPQWTQHNSQLQMYSQQSVQEPQIIVRKVDQVSQTDLNEQDLKKQGAKIQRLEKQLIGENEANDDLTEQLDDAYKAGYKTRLDNFAKVEENKRLDAKVKELELRIKQLEEEQAVSKQKGCESCIDYIKDMKRMEFDV